MGGLKESLAPRAARGQVIMPEMVMGLEPSHGNELCVEGQACSTGYALHRMLEHVRGHLVHLPSLHRGGFFMQRGSRFYVDGSHPEWATEECTDPKTLVMAAEEGHRTLGKLAAAAQSASTPETEVSVFRCNVRYPGSNHSDTAHATWASHENYGIRHKSPSEMAQQLIPFLVSRICLSGGWGIRPFRERPGVYLVSTGTPYRRSGRGMRARMRGRSSFAGPAVVQRLQTASHFAGGDAMFA